MPIPDNTAPMMTGEGSFGSVEMGGMFSVLKVRDNQPAGDYKNPGWYTHPAGTVASEYTGELAPPRRATDKKTSSAMPLEKVADIEVQVRKPKSHKKHG